MALCRSYRSDRCSLTLIKATLGVLSSAISSQGTAPFLFLFFVVVDCCPAAVKAAAFWRMMRLFLQATMTDSSISTGPSEMAPQSQRSCIPTRCSTSANKPVIGKDNTHMKQFSWGQCSEEHHVHHFWRTPDLCSCRRLTPLPPLRLLLLF